MIEIREGVLTEADGPMLIYRLRVLHDTEFCCSHCN